MNEDVQPSDFDEPWAIFERSSPGWFRVTLTFEDEAEDEADSSPELYVGGVIDPDGRVGISGLALLGHSLSSAHLREIPLRRIEAALNSPVCRGWVSTASGAPHPLRELQQVADEGPAQVYEQTELRPRLTRPDRSDPRAFYRQVADAYRQYVKHSNRPAVEIATEAGVPVATARRWINHARELGLLEKGQRGRAI